MPDGPAMTRARSAGQIRPGEAAFLMTGVFLMFAPVMVLAVSDLAPERPLRTFFFWAAVSGLTAVAWAGLGMLRPKLLPLAAVLQFAVVMMFAMQRPRPFAIGLPRVSVEGLGSILCMAAGYFLFIMFIRRQANQNIRLETEKARLSTELELASQIHRALVPDIACTAGGLEVHARSVASGQMGGDLTEVLTHDGVTDVYLADVSGHGVRAGVVMGMVKSAVRTRLLTPAELPSLLDDLNRVLAGSVEPGMFATFAALRFRAAAAGGAEMDVEYALAGHLPIFHIRDGATLAELPNDRLPLGLIAEETYVSGRTTARPGDVFALYTDGLTEVADASERQLGHEALGVILARHAPRPLAEAHAAVFAEVAAHGPQLDDQTLVLVRVVAAPTDGVNETPVLRSPLPLGEIG